MRSLSAILAVANLALGAVATFQLPASAQGMSSEAKAWCKRAVPALREVLRQDPAKAAKSASDAGDLTYLEVHGFAAHIPGIKDQQCARTSVSAKLLEGTSDALCSPEHGELQGPARRFAEAYNLHMAAERRARGLVTCHEA